MTQRTKEERIKADLIWNIMYGIKKEMDAEIERSTKYIEANKIGVEDLDRRTIYERRFQEMLWNEALKTAQQIAIDAIKKASISC